MRETTKLNRLLASAFLLMISAVVLPISNAGAQTVLSGDHEVEGNLKIGNTNQKGGLTIAGEIGSNASPALGLTGDGGVVFEGIEEINIFPWQENRRSRLLWLAEKGALVVGSFSVSDNRIDDGLIGYFSTALGDSVAAGSHSFATGRGSSGGDYFFAINGGYVNGYGHYGIAMNPSAASFPSIRYGSPLTLP